jgi:hypothetical protein
MSGDSTIDNIVLLLTSGITLDRAVSYCIAQLGIKDGEARKIVDEARRRIIVSADYNRDEQLGTAIARLNDLYAKSIKVNDVKTALHAQRELNRLMGLYPVEPDGGNVESVSNDAAKRLSVIEGYLLPLCIVSEKYPIEEHARVAADFIRKTKSSVQRGKASS